MKTCIACDSNMSNTVAAVLSVASAQTSSAQGVAAPSQRNNNGGLRSSATTRRRLAPRRAASNKAVSKEDLEAMMRTSGFKHTPSTASPAGGFGSMSVSQLSTTEDLEGYLKMRLPLSTDVSVKTYKKDGQRYVVLEQGGVIKNLILVDHVIQFLKIEEYLHTQSFPAIGKGDEYTHFLNSMKKDFVAAVEMSKHSSLKKIVDSTIQLYRTAFGDDFSFTIDNDNKAVVTTTLEYEKQNFPKEAVRSTIELTNESLAAPLKALALMREEERAAIGSHKEFMKHFPTLKAQVSGGYRQRDELNSVADINIVDLANDCKNFLHPDETTKFESKVDKLFEDPKRQEIRDSVLAYHSALMDYAGIQRTLGLAQEFIPHKSAFTNAGASSLFGTPMAAAKSPFASTLFPTAVSESTKAWEAALRIYSVIHRQAFRQSVNYMKGANQRLLCALAGSSGLRELHGMQLPSIQDLTASAKPNKSFDKSKLSQKHAMIEEEAEILHNKIETARNNLMQNPFLLNVVYETIDRD